MALGTSLPEVATCVVAARRKQPDIAIGNVIGSNIFNILAVLGVTASIFPLHIQPEHFHVDGLVMLLAAVLCFPIMRTGHEISRGEGGFLVSVYAVYLVGILAFMPP